MSSLVRGRPCSKPSPDKDARVSLRCLEKDMIEAVDSGGWAEEAIEQPPSQSSTFTTAAKGKPEQRTRKTDGRDSVDDTADTGAMALAVSVYSVEGAEGRHFQSLREGTDKRSAVLAESDHRCSFG